MTPNYVRDVDVARGLCRAGHDLRFNLVRYHDRSRRCMACANAKQRERSCPKPKRRRRFHFERARP